MSPKVLLSASLSKLFSKNYKLLISRNSLCNISTSTDKERVFSGIQPTGTLHLGNYFGAIRKWVELQETCQSVLYSIVDLHSITLPQDPKLLHRNILEVTACLLACGINPTKSILFQQSKVSQHAELSWVLGCMTTMARLGHLPQFKEKSTSVKDTPLGIFVYPVLQSADILVYKATKVPVGEDQLQHLQLAQHLAKTFNLKYGILFPHPKALINEDCTARLRSLRDPTKKMSKSELDPRSRIELTDSKEAIFEKVKKALTDLKSAVTWDPKDRPGVSNLIAIHSGMTGKTPEEIVEDVQGLDTGKYKLVVADIINKHVQPIREETKRILKDHLFLEQILEDGSRKASSIAEETLKSVRKLVGLSS